MTLSVLGGIMAFFGNLGAPELLVIAFIVLLLFGGRKIPELMRGLGKGVRNFKEGMNDVTDEIKKIDEDIKKDGNK